MSRISRSCTRTALLLNKRIWRLLDAFVKAYGRRLNKWVCLYDDRNQNHSTFFMRNRAELELLRMLVDQRPSGSKLDFAVLGCSMGAEVYSMLWTIRSTRPDLKVTTHAIDISQDIVDFSEKGIYRRNNIEAVAVPNGVIHWDIFERMTAQELSLMFDLEGDQAIVKYWLRQGIVWMRGDAADPKIVESLGLQDIVVANRFLCHMKPAAAEGCLRNLARLVKPGGYLFVSGIDIDVRTKVAKELGWKPVETLLRDIHEGDAPSLRDNWPTDYWGLEPFSAGRADWQIRYASVFQVGGIPDQAAARAEAKVDRPAALQTTETVGPSPTSARMR